MKINKDYDVLTKAQPNTAKLMIFYFEQPTPIDKRDVIILTHLTTREYETALLWGRDNGYFTTSPFETQPHLTQAGYNYVVYRILGTGDEIEEFKNLSEYCSLTIIYCLANNDEGMTLDEIAQAVDKTVSDTLEWLRILRNFGLISILKRAAYVRAYKLSARGLRFVEWRENNADNN